MASHDLKSPLNNLEGHFELLKLDFESKNYDEINDSIHWIEESLKEAKNTIVDLTKVLEFRKVLNEPEEIDFFSLLEEVKKGLHKKVLDSKAIIQNDFSDAPLLNYSRIGAKSVLQNLLSNSLKYASPDRDPIINISTKRIDNFVCLIVADNGIGIDLGNHKDDLFGLFKRINVDQEGSGIGLYMIKRMIDYSGGKIEVESEIDKGAKFKVYFNTDFIMQN